MTRGGWRGGTRPRKPDSERRVPVGCRVTFANKAWLEAEKDRTGQGIGLIVDSAIELLQGNPEKHFPGIEEVPADG